MTTMARWSRARRRPGRRRGHHDLRDAGRRRAGDPAWRPLARRLLAVAGNCDSAAIDARLVELGVSIHGRGVVVDDVGIAGASGSPLTSPTPYELRDEEFARHAATGLAAIESSRVRVLCPHAPPRGTKCDRLGRRARRSPALRALIERNSPISSSVGTSTSRVRSTSSARPGRQPRPGRRRPLCTRRRNDPSPRARST